MRIDSHQHFWRYNASEYDWMQPDWPIRRDLLPPDLAPLLSHGGFSGSVAVQARQCLDENRFLLGLADEHPLIKGVVGWVDLRSDRVEEQLIQFAGHPKFVGVRHVVQDEPDDFMLGEDFLRGIAALRQFELTYDILIYPKQLPAALQLVERFPEQPFVLDHLAKPPIREGVLSPWREQIQLIAGFPNVHCKVSGMVTEANWSAWKPADFTPYLDVVFEAFGVGRLMFGSDWPVCLLAASYEQGLQLVSDYVAPLSPQAREAFFGGNATEFYTLGSEGE
ncbi:MAG: amidohydrolase family protein [Planctomycetes bacterium]|nr:amidohydrolase family protein [Planctomycetota bacterium]